MIAGEVRWVELPARGGRAQAGRRPAIITQNISSLPTTLLIPFTTQLDALRFPGTLLVEKDAANGLRQTSVALVFQLTAVDNRYIRERLGIIAEAVMESIWATFDEITGRL